MAARSTIVAVLLAVLAATGAWAGTGPETTVVVANADSPTSLRVAHAYRALRDLPPSHLLVLEDVPPEPVVDVETFRKKILAPIESWLEAEGLADSVEVVAYSTDFPYGVDFGADLKAAGVSGGRGLGRIASLTALTFFGRHVLKKDAKGYLGLQTNRYFRRPPGLRGAGGGPGASPAEMRLVQEATGAPRSKDFRRAETAYRKLTEAFPDRPDHWYNLACCLALLGKNDAALDALEQAVAKGFGDADHAAGDPDLESLRGNPRFDELLERMRRPGGEGDEGMRIETLARAFDASAAWGEDGKPLADAPADDPHRYRLAVMLGWTGAYGNTVDEVLRALHRSAKADGSLPSGTVYLMANKNVRSTTRQPFFPATVAALERLGRKAEILKQGEGGQDGILPRGKDDVIGLVAGTARFRWGDDVAELLPGAIAEHLTSFGAHFSTPGQTKCTEFIRHGAAGSSGTVAEPLALAQKFPLPFLHVYYARGCSLAEAFYQSIWGPYQLLILGDPLTRPFARFSDVTIEAPPAGAPWKGRVGVRASVKSPTGVLTGRLELWVDGRRATTGEVGKPLAFDTTSVPDGHHEIRVVAVDGGPIGTRSTVRTWVEVRNGLRRVEATAPAAPVELGETLRIEGRAQGVASVALRQGSRRFEPAPVKDGLFTLEVPSLTLGLGPSLLQVEGLAEGKVAALSAPIEVEVLLPSTTQAALVIDEGRLLGGLAATVQGAGGKPGEGIVGSLGAGRGRTLGHDLADLGVPAPTRLHLEGRVRVPEGLAEFEVRGAGPVTVTLDGQPLVAWKAPPASGRRVVPVLLAEGWHALSIDAEGPKANEVALFLGGSRPRAALGGEDLAHRAPEDWQPAAPPERVEGVKTGKEAPALGDGDTGGKGVVISGEGVALVWKRSQRRLCGVRLVPARRKNPPSGFPAAWIVETRSSAQGRWRAVKKLEAVSAPPPEAPGKKVSWPPRYVLLSFKDKTARQLRIRPADASVTPRLTEIQAWTRKR
ncbi:MAG: tetratricopeptide repeat protein [Planctomycetota bacterium]